MCTYLKSVAFKTCTQMHTAARVDGESAQGLLWAVLSVLLCVVGVMNKKQKGAWRRAINGNATRARGRPPRLVYFFCTQLFVAVRASSGPV